MDDPHDQHPSLRDRVKDPVLAMNQATDFRADLGPQRRSEWKVAENGECIFEATHVNIGNGFPELGKAMGVDFLQVGNRRVGKGDLSRASSSAWR